jgi:hypothetical protein
MKRISRINGLTDKEFCPVFNLMAKDTFPWTLHRTRITGSTGSSGCLLCKLKGWNSGKEVSPKQAPPGYKAVSSRPASWDPVFWKLPLSLKTNHTRPKHPRHPRSISIPPFQPQKQVKKTSLPGERRPVGYGWYWSVV